MDKILLNSESDFNIFVTNYTGILPGRGAVSSWLDNPKQYPCVCVYEIQYNGNGPDMLDGDFVYFDDFNKI